MEGNNNQKGGDIPVVNTIENEPQKRSYEMKLEVHISN